MKKHVLKTVLTAVFLSLMLGTQAQVTVTYKVDISSYLAGGATLGANGIRIGGNFTAINAPLPDWQPSAVQCGMTNTGNNVWSITVTYPASSIGLTQLFKFVNNDWGNNEGGPASTIVSGGCGADDGSGNINRRLVIPSQNSTVCFVWDACTSCQSGSIPVVSTGFPANAITSASATVGGSASGSGITSRGICYATTPNPTIANSLASAGNGEGNFNANLNGLSPLTTYYVRAFATNSSGTGYGNEINFTTLPELDITAITGTASEITSNSASVSGTISGTGISTRGICYSTNQNPTLQDSISVSGSGPGSFTASLINLLPNTTYYARAFGSGPAGTAFGTQISFSTSPAQPQGIDVTYKVDITDYLTAGNNLGANGIRIAGNFADFGASANGIAMVNWTPAHAGSAMTDEGNNIWSITVTYPSSAAGQTQLYKFVNNDWGSNEGGSSTAIVSGNCGLDDGAGNINRRLQIPASAQTLSYCWDQCSACGSQTLLPVVSTADSATAITPSTASVGGTATGTGITAKGICYSISQNPTIASSIASGGSGEGPFSANLSGLFPATIYYARAFATNNAGTSYGAQISFTTRPSQVQTSTVTYTVDLSNYLSSGNAISPAGIRIAGNFADRGARVNGVALSNWNPADPATAMTNTGNLWSITVTFPDSSFGKVLSYKFVNGTWAGSGGDNEGVSASSGIESGGCGMADPGGNINRMMAIPATTSSLSFCWDQCSACSGQPTAPQVSTTDPATSITNNSASVSGNATGTGITSRGVCFGLSQNPTLSDSVSLAGSGSGAFTASLIGLNPGTLYYARAFASNAAGTTYGNQVSFTTQTGQVQTVNLTYQVDVTAYLAAGNSIGAGGIRIAGNFASLGAKVNGVPMANWNPLDAASAMSNNGNIWSVIVSYPDSSIGKTQVYKFVNNNWGTNEGTDPSNTLASGGCGVDDGAGNINRLQSIPAASGTLTYCWDQCTSTCITGISPSVKNSIYVYPLPFADYLMIESETATEYRIVSLLGKEILKGRADAGNNRLETAALPSGIYLLQAGKLPPRAVIKR